MSSRAAMRSATASASGRDGFLWSGRANIQYGKKWPTWTPPAEMIKRKPELEKWRGGQPGGLDNPLGARALYIFKDGADTGYRVHGSPEWVDHRPGDVVRLRPHDQPGRHRPVQPGQRQDADRGGMRQ